MLWVEIGDVLAVGIVGFVGSPVPDHAQSRDGWRARRYQPSEEPERQVVAEVASVSVLHVSTIAQRWRARSSSTALPFEDRLARLHRFRTFAR